MSAEIKQKKDYVKRLQLLKEENEIPVAIRKLRNAWSHIEHALNTVKSLERKQEERLKAEIITSVSAEEPSQAAPPPAEAVTQEQPVQAIQEPIVESVPEKPVEKKPDFIKQAPKPPVAPAAPVVPKSEPATRTKQFTQDTSGRPSFMSANQRRPLTGLRAHSPQPHSPQSGNQAQGQTPRVFGARPGGFTNNRPPHSGAPRPFGAKPGISNVPAPDVVNKPRQFEQKKDFTKSVDDKKAMSKRTLIRKGLIEDAYGEDRMGSKKIKRKKQMANKDMPKISSAIITSETTTVKQLSETMGISAAAIIKQFMELGKMVNINSFVDYESMELVADVFGVTLTKNVSKTKEEELDDFHAEDDTASDLMVERPPIVTVMGHVDHGKTSLLDALRKTSIAQGEAGGITQHIGAYSVMLDGKKITFIDTPGHEAFTEMRARGAKVTDIAIIVVAADDGIMPQTIEAINHAKAAEVPIIIAANKIDKPTADIDRIKQQLTGYGIVPEDWGGDSPVIGVSAKTGKGLDILLKNILMMAELKELKANPDRRAKGTIVEAKLDKNRGPLATIIVQNGTLHIGDTVVAGMTYGHIRAMQDERGLSLKEAGPSTAVSVLGFQEVPDAGISIQVVEDEKLAKQVIEERINKLKSQEIMSKNLSLDELYSRISEEQIKALNLIVKADTQGTVEAVKASLLKLGNEEVRIRTIHGGVGAVNKSDLMLAEASNAIIIAFNVKADADAQAEADRSGVDIRIYSIIYDAIDDITKAVKGMLTPKYKEQVIGHAEVRNVFKITGSGTIAGCYIKDGKVLRNAKVRILRDGKVIATESIDGLKRFKDDVKEVASGYECGISISDFSDIKELDVLEVFSMEQTN